MTTLYVTIGSVTSATRLAKKLRALGMEVRVVHTPAEINRGGCSYSVRTDYRNLDKIRQYVSDYRVKVRRYSIEQEVNGRKVYHDIP